MKNILDKLTTNRDTFEFVLNSIPLHVIITDVDGKILFANKTVEKITGFTQKEIIGENPRLWGRQMKPEFYKDFWKEIKKKKKTFSGVVTNKRKNGMQYYAAAKVSPILDEDDKLIGFCGIEQDITEIQRLSDKHDLNEKQREIIKRTNVL